MPDSQTHDKNYVAILDIGSNAVRLVVYDGIHRAPFKIHSERSICNLGADLATTGRLNPDSVKRALDSIRRFSGLLSAMNIRHVQAVATAAIRDAADGAEFIRRVHDAFGLDIRIIDGEEEARLSALGVLGSGTGDSGIIGDYGGGSLELIVFENRAVVHKASLPIGVHRLLGEAPEAADALIRRQLEGAPFLARHRGLDFYALGGAWRSMAKAHMHMSHYPLRLIDHYTIDGVAALEFARLLTRQSTDTLEKSAGLSKKRLKDMGVAAQTMERLFETVAPARVVFSATGLREGLIFDQLTGGARTQNPLAASCAKIAFRISRFDNLKGFFFLARWMRPLFEGEGGDFFTLMEASCFLSDTGWFENDDCQADHAFARVLMLPLYGIDHAGRAFLALSQYVRYRGFFRPPSRHGAGPAAETVRPALHILGSEKTAQAATVGLAQRLAYLLTGGALSLLKGTTLTLTPTHLILKLDPGLGNLSAEIVDDALAALARSVGRTGTVTRP